MALQQGKPFIQSTHFYAFLHHSTICAHHSGFWGTPDRNSEMLWWGFVTGFCCSLPMHLHEAPLCHLPQQLQVRSAVGRHPSTSTDKWHSAFRWRASDADPLAGDLLGVQSFEVHVGTSFCPLLGEAQATELLHLQVAGGVTTMRPRSLVKTAMHKLALAWLLISSKYWTDINSLIKG